VVVTHDTLSPGDPCPCCQEGILYRQQDWRQVVRLAGQPPVGGQRYELERLRCGLCGEVQTAPLPEEAGPNKYDPTVASIIALLRYGQGVPWNRIQQLQAWAGIPLPASVQWELVRDAIPCGPEAVYQQLLWEAAQGNLMHNDDTHMCILELTEKIKNQEPLRGLRGNRLETCIAGRACRGVGLLATGDGQVAQRRPVFGAGLQGWSVAVGGKLKSHGIPSWFSAHWGASNLPNLQNFCRRSRRRPWQPIGLNLA
jgi:hypothetical protein